jgi:hypothetical protein
MKVPELYTHEVLTLIKFIDQYAEKVVAQAKQIRKRIEFRQRFWRFGIHGFMVNSMLRLAILEHEKDMLRLAILEHEMQCSKELREKLLASTGTDEDEKSITLADVIEKMRSKGNA